MSNPVPCYCRAAVPMVVAGATTCATRWLDKACPYTPHTVGYRSVQHGPTPAAPASLCCCIRRTLWKSPYTSCSMCWDGVTGSWVCPAAIRVFNTLLGNPDGTSSDFIETDGDTGTSRRQPVASPVASQAGG